MAFIYHAAAAEEEARKGGAVLGGRRRWSVIQQRPLYSHLDQTDHSWERSDTRCKAQVQMEHPLKSVSFIERGNNPFWLFLTQITLANSLAHVSFSGPHGNTAAASSSSVRLPYIAASISLCNWIQRRRLLVRSCMRNQPLLGLLVHIMSIKAPNRGGGGENRETN